MKSRIFSPVLFVLLFTSVQLFAQEIRVSEVDSLIERAIKTFNVPGIAVGIVRDGKLIVAKGYGVRSIATGEKVDASTNYGIASNTKAFTTMAIGILIDRGLLHWDDKLTDYIPEFRLYDPWVTSEFTVRDMLTHRSGLGLGAGDLMLWPAGTDFTIDDIIHNLRYLKPVSSFRSKYDYDNNMYIIAGELIRRISKMSYEEFVEKNIMTPLQMNKSAVGYTRLKDKSDVVDPHAVVEDKLVIVGRDEGSLLNSAGGIYSNVNDLSKWVIMHLNNGKYGDDLKEKLVSERVHNDMWSVNTVLQPREPAEYHNNFAGYGLGWNLFDALGHKVVYHTGGLAGMITRITMIPDLKLGIIVLTNQQSGAINPITNAIIDRYLGIKGIDRINQLQKSDERAFSFAKRINDSIRNIIYTLQKSGEGTKDYSSITGTYNDKWFGDITISEKVGKLLFEAKRSPDLKGEMIQYKNTTYIVRWFDRSLDADAYVMFFIDKSGHATQVKMLPVSPLTDFSFDFQDLDFRLRN